MAKTKPTHDEHIAHAEPFARPILKHLRTLVHSACPNVEEAFKWSFPVFMYKGAILCSMASFKNHCAFGFWKASIMKDPYGIFPEEKETSMGHLGKIISLKDLPSDKILIEYIQEAAILNEKGIRLPPRPKNTVKTELKVPEYFRNALSTNKVARSTFEKFSPTNKKDYVEWITEAKTEETRERRMATALEWMAEGKIRNWKYVRK